MRHVLHRQNRRNHPLVPVPPRHLVAHLQLAPLRNRHPHLLLHPRRQLVRLVAGENPHIHHRPMHPVRHPQRRVLHLPRLLPENRPQQLLLRRQLRLALRRDLAHQNVARLHLRADPHNPVRVQVPQRLFRHIRNVPRDLLVAQLRLARPHLVLRHVNRSELVVLHQPLRHDHRVLEVVALPGHERRQHVLPQRQLPVIRRRRIGNRLPALHPIPAAHNRPLVDARALIRAQKLDQRVRRLAPPTVVAHRDRLRTHAHHLALALRHQHLPRIERRRTLHPRPHQRRLRTHQRHRLPLHVRPHQRPVRVVVLQKRNQTRRHRHNLPRRHIHVVDLVRVELVELLAAAALHTLLQEIALAVDLRVGLRHHRLALIVRRQLHHLVRHIGPNRHRRIVGRRDPLHQLGAHRLIRRRNQLARRILHILRQHPTDQIRVIRRQLTDHPPVRRLDEAVLVQHPERRQTADQPDVRTLRRLNRADPPVVAVMHIAHVEARPIPAQPARAQRRKPPLVRQLRQRIRLIHELAQLVPPEKLLDRRLHRANVHQRARRRLIRVDDRHPLPDHPLHPAHPHPELTLQLLPHRANPTVAQMIDVVRQLALIVHRDLRVNHRQQIAQPERPPPRLVRLLPLRIQLQRRRPLRQRQIHLPHPLVHLVAPHAAQVVAPRIEKLPLQQTQRRLRRRRVARPQPLVQLVHRPLFVALLRRRARRLLRQRRLDELMHRAVVVRPLQHLQNALVRAQPRIDLRPAPPTRRPAALLKLVQLRVIQRPQQRRHRDLPLPVHLHRQNVPVARLELQPRPPIRNQLRRAERPTRRRIRVRPEIHPRRAHQLRHHHPLRAVDDERPRLRHVRQIAEIEPLLLALPALLRGQLHVDLQTPRVRRIPPTALVRRLLRRHVAVVLERQLHPIAREIRNRRHLDEQLPQPLIQEPLVGIAQHLNQIRQLVRFRQARVVDRLQRGENHEDSLQDWPKAAEAVGWRGAQRRARSRAEWTRREHRVGCAGRGGETAAGRRLRQSDPRRSVRSVARRRGAGLRSPNADVYRAWVINAQPSPNPPRPSSTPHHFTACRRMSLHAAATAD